MVGKIFFYITKREIKVMKVKNTPQDLILRGGILTRSSNLTYKIEIRAMNHGL